MANPSTFPRPLQSGPKRKLECLPEIISARVLHPYKNLAKVLCRSRVTIPHNTGPLRNLLPSLLDTTQQRDFAIGEVNHTARSLSYFKRYNAFNQVQVIIDGGEYFCMSIPTIKRGDLNSSKRITMCKSCGYRDPHDPHYQL